ncbi:MAG: Eco57I restriction-modification methylase domain-containing protein [Spirochaetota bacterium]|nr:Eco57I restriction-modification methylase domain-containing protein [Spirochaetota bacterium]
MAAGDFNSIDSIIDAFSVEKVTREFYQEIANWYFWALKNVKFPQDAENEPNGKEMAVIRLITRLIFIWFMKIEGLVPDQLFDEIFIKDILKNYKPNNDDYYKAILQNLFFATLNTKQENRRFRSNIRGHKGYNPDFGNNYVYRYEDLFKESEKIIKEYFLQIPFLNGGLFECLDHKSKDELRYIDGFTDVVKHQPKIPNYLFFSNEEIVDLNSDYGTKNKKYKVRGLMNIFRSYNFTIDENTYDDAEVALDPELLGKIFENLLASYNPETAKTARKETGSYYTPREIVDYMVEQSLREYFKANMHSINDKVLDELFSPVNESKYINLDEYTKKSLIELIYNLKVVDPAVGSGAFPMGMLHKLVFLLQKLDPDNEQWKTMQIEDVKRNIKDPTLASKFIKQIEEKFAEKNDDYGRKLYLIEKCLYGVDIQPIAIEIARLRFFISLLVDEKIDKNKENYGIEPLPNLDFKLIQGNSLINSFHDIDLRYNESIQALREKLNPKITKLETLKHQYQYAYDVKDKKDLMESIENSILDIFLTHLEIYYQDDLSFIKNSFIFENKEQKERDLKNYYKQKGFDIDKAIDELKDYIELTIPKNFFLWNIFFAEVFNEKGGFDIVIGNPPYIQLQKDRGKLADVYKNKGYETFDRMGDIYVLFYEKGLQLLKKDGILAYITSNKWMRAGYGEKLRRYLIKFNPLILIDLGPGVFENATVDTNILLIQKSSPNTNRQSDNNSLSSESQFSLRALTLTKENTIDISKQLYEKGVIISKLTKDAWFIGSSAEQKLKEKIERIGKPLKDWDVNIYYGIKTGLNEAFIITTEKRNEILANCNDEEERKRTEAIIKPILRGRDIKRYYYEWAGLWVIGTFPALGLNIDEYPALKKYFLDNFDIRQLEQSGKKYPERGFNARKKTDNEWFETQDTIAYYPEFEKEKVVWQRITQEPTFCLVEPNVFILDSMAFFVGNNLKYVMALLNSKLIYKYVNMVVHQYGFTGFRLSNQYVEIIPLPPITPANKSIVLQIEVIVDKILAAKKQDKNADISERERKIDRLMYSLYELTEEEIKIIGKNLK